MSIPALFIDVATFARFTATPILAFSSADF